MRLQYKLLGMGLAALLMTGGLQTASAASQGGRREEKVGKKVAEATAKKIDYINRLALFDVEQITLAHMAAERATTPEVKQLAQQLEQQHLSHLQTLQAYADGERLQLALVDLASQDTATGGAGTGGTGEGVSPGADAALQKLDEEAQKQNKEYQKEVREFVDEHLKLASKTGQDFDKSFLDKAKDRAKQGEKMVNDGLKKYRDDPALAAVLARSAPELQGTVKTIEATEKSLKQSKRG